MGRERVTAVVVGAGIMGRWHSHAIGRNGGAVVGVVDSDPARGAALAATQPGARSFSRLEEAVAALAPEIVHICTPLGSHADLVDRALQGGCHVLAEKPLTPTAGETRVLLGQAEAAGRLLIPVHQFAFQRGALALQERLASLGPLFHLEMGTASAGASGMPSGPETVAAEILPHFLSLTHRLLGVRLTDQDWQISRPLPGEWRVTGSCGAISVAFLISMAARPTFAELRALGGQGSARLDLFHGYAVFEPGTVSRRAKLTRPFRVAGHSLAAASVNLARRALGNEPAYPGLTELVRQVYLAVRGEGPNPILPLETLDVAATRDRLMDRAATAAPA